MEDLNINRVSFEEIQEFHDLNMDDLVSPIDQVILYDIVTRQFTTTGYVPGAGSQGLDDVLRIENISNLGMDVGEITTTGITVTNILEAKDAAIQFKVPAVGVYPTLDTHLSTKKYVDDTMFGGRGSHHINGSFSVNGNSAAENELEITTDGRVLLDGQVIINGVAGQATLAGKTRIMDTVSIDDNIQVKYMYGTSATTVQYTGVFRDGTKLVGFDAGGIVIGGTISGNAPTANAHLTTKEYVDNAIKTTIDNTLVGTIIMWSGALSAIPTGWHMCDGSNGTPNLIDKFIRGSATAGTTGGSDNAEVISHTHATNHTHEIFKSYTNGKHSHSYYRRKGDSSKDKTGNAVKVLTTELDTTTIDGDHNHTINIPPYTGTSGSTGVAGNGKNMPAFYSLIYIQFKG